MGQTLLWTLAPCASFAAPALTTQNVFGKVKKLSILKAIQKLLVRVIVENSQNFWLNQVTSLVLQY